LGDTPAHRALWRDLDRLADVFWRASRAGMKLPIRNLGELVSAVRLLRPTEWPLVRFLRSTMADALASHGLLHDRPLVSLLSMLIEDTTHSTVHDAPLINAALGVTIRGAGLMRPAGGCHGFWRRFTDHYRSLGGTLCVGSEVTRIDRRPRGFRVYTRRGELDCTQVVSAVPAALTRRIAPFTASALDPYLERDASAVGGAIILFLGVPEAELSHELTHHQILADYDAPLGNGNNMFISASAADDLESAPPGHRAVMISTHCQLPEWQGLSADEYAQKKNAIGRRLLTLARRVHPELGTRAVIMRVGTPLTYERFTRRPRGAVGGVRQTLANSNQRALPHDVGPPGFWMVGDSTWPGLGTVACVLGSRIVASALQKRTTRWMRHPSSAILRRL
jgi:phytoene dehydrogenase-like protein